MDFYLIAVHTWSIYRNGKTFEENICRINMQ
jgi:hypothetical protein